MKIAICTSPLKDQSRVQGIGFYTKRLIKALKQVDKKNQYIFFTQGQKLPKTDLIHYPYFDLFALTLPLVKGVKTVVTVHDVTPLVFARFFPPGLRGWLKLQIQKFSLKSATAVICDSKCSKRDIKKFLGVPTEKIHVVYLAAGEEFKKLEIRNWKLEICRKYSLPEHFVLYVGDVTRNKNIPALVKACQKAKTPLVIVGKQAVNKNIDKNHPENRDLAWLQDYCSQHLPPTTYHLPPTLTGFVPTKDLVKIYNLATIYVQPSLYEGFGLPVLEAMACGCPVISGDTSSIPEIAQNAAILVDPTNIGNLALCIRGVFEDEGMQKELSEQGLKQVKKFSWEKTARETIKVYEKVMRGEMGNGK